MWSRPLKRKDFPYNFEMHWEATTTRRENLTSKFNAVGLRQIVNGSLLHNCKNLVLKITSDNKHITNGNSESWPKLFVNHFTLWNIFTDRIRRMREGNVFSLSTPVGGGGVPGQVQMGGIPAKSTGGYPISGTPHQTWLGVPLPGGYPTLGNPPIGPGQGGNPARGGGYPTSGNPPIGPTWGYPTSGTPLSDLAQVVPHLRYLPPPHQTWLGEYSYWGGTPSRVTPHHTWPGGVPLPGGYPTSGNRWSTWYAAVGMPLAFTQEDFLVLCSFENLVKNSKSWSF